MDNRTTSSHFQTSLKHNENVNKAFSFICESYKIKEAAQQRLKENIYKLECNFKLKWEEAHRKRSAFEFNNEKRLLESSLLTKVRQDQQESVDDQRNLFLN